MSIYLDNAATTRVCPEAAEAAMRAMTDIWGNPLTIDEPLVVEDKNFTHEFTPKLKLVGTLGSEFITELKIFAEPENQDESFKVINVLGLLIATLNPELDTEDRGEVLRDLRMLKEVSAEGVYDWTTNRGVVEYSVHNDSGKSIFTAKIK